MHCDKFHKLYVYIWDTGTGTGTGTDSRITHISYHSWAWQIETGAVQFVLTQTTNALMESLKDFFPFESISASSWKKTLLDCNIVREVPNYWAP